MSIASPRSDGGAVFAGTFDGRTELILSDANGDDVKRVVVTT